MDDNGATALWVLGPLEVVRDGERVRLGSGQQRLLLAVLAVHANEVVSSDRLVDVLWGAGPPPSALHALRGLVSRLRATLGHDFLLATSPPGYRLQVASGEVDAMRFEALVRVGLGASQQQDVARRTFDEALAMWRGSPYVEFASEEFAAAEVARLVELRARAVEERAAALLELGRPDDVIGDLEAEIASEPFRERLRGLLMLGLARAGRPVEALRAYDAFRRFLADEVGVVPSPGLQELNDDIVRQHPDVSWAGSPARETVTSALPSRNNLPAPVDSFVGRRVELADVLDALRDGRLVTLTGPGGSGKTRLGLEAASAALGSVRDGVWFVSLALAGDDERVVTLVAAALGVAELTDEPVADTLEEWLRDRQLLLVLDNCEPVVGAVAAFAERYLQRCAGVRILATTREVLGVRGERVLSTPPLHVVDDPAHAGESDAVELFMVRAAAAAGFNADLADVGTIVHICRRLDGLPLAIELAAARLRTLSLEQIASRLDDRFRLLRAGERTLEAVVVWSYDLLTAPEREVFVRLAVFPADFSLDAAETVVSDEVVEAGDVLELLSRLVEKSLVATVKTDSTYRYRLLETLREYALARLAERGEVDRWSDRLLEWAMTRVEHVEVSLRRPAQDAALQSVIADGATLLAAMNWANSQGDHLAALRIASAVPIALTGERRQIIADLLARAGTAVDGWVAGHAYSALGELAYDQGDWTAASKAISISHDHFVAAGSNHHAAWADLNGAYAAWGMGDLQEVDRVITEAIGRFRKGEDALGLGYSLSVASLRTSDLDEAQQLGSKADELLRAAGSPMGIAHSVEGQGIVAYDRDELADAAVFVAEAVEIYRSCGNLGCSAHGLEAAAAIVSRSGRAAVATELLSAANELRQRSGAGHKPWEIRGRHGDIEDRIAPLCPAEREAALSAGRQHTLESAARAALDALATVTRE